MDEYLGVVFIHDYEPVVPVLVEELESALASPTGTSVVECLLLGKVNQPFTLDHSVVGHKTRIAYLGIVIEDRVEVTAARVV